MGVAGAHARLRSKQQLLDLLSERARDQASYTRAQVLVTWGSLVEAGAVPMSHWLFVARLAIGRLSTLPGTEACCGSSAFAAQKGAMPVSLEK